MSIKILIVDESASVHKIVATAFESQNATVKSVTKTEEALTKMRSYQPDIVLANADSSGLSGYDLCQQIKESDKFGDTPVLLLTGRTDAFDKKKFKTCQANGYIVKPFRSDDLVQKVQQLLNPEKIDLASSAVEPSSAIEKNADGNFEIGDTTIDMDDMMSDIIGESGLETNSTAETREMETIESENDPTTSDDPLAVMEDIMGDIIGESGLETNSTAETREMETIESENDPTTSDDPLAVMEDIMSDIIGEPHLEKESSQNVAPESIKLEKLPETGTSKSSEKTPPREAQKTSPAPIKLSLSQKIDQTPAEHIEASPTKAQQTSDAANFSPPQTLISNPKPSKPEMANEDMSLEEMLNSAEASLGDNEVEQKTEKTISKEVISEPEEKPNLSISESELAEPGETSETLVTSDASHVPPSTLLIEPKTNEDSLAEVEVAMDSADKLDSTFQTIQQFEDEEETPQDSQSANELDPVSDARSAFAEDMAQFEIKPEPEDLLERLAPSAFTASGLQGKPDLVKETLSYLSDLSPNKKESVVSKRPSKQKPLEKSSKNPQRIKRKEIFMSTEYKGDLFVQIVGEHIKRILERSLEESIAKEISGLSETIERSVREIVKEVTPEIARSIIQEEIEKIRKLEEV